MPFSSSSSTRSFTPRRLAREEKPIYDRGQRLRAAVLTNQEEGASRKEEIEIQQLPSDYPVKELWRVMAGLEPGRTGDRQITLFDSVGFAIEDFSTAISLSADAPEPYNGRGLSYLALGDDENAFADFNMRGNILPPPSPPLYVNTEYTFRKGESDQ